MRWIALAALLLASVKPAPEIRYFRHFADVSMPDRSEQQAYVPLPPEIWRESRPDLGDLRLYANTQAVPYALMPNRSAEVLAAIKSKLINIGTVANNTQFVLQLEHADAVPEFDSVRVDLRDGAQDFIAEARVEGLYRLNGDPVDLGASTLFRLGKERLGENLVARFRPATFPYLRLTIPHVKPHDVRGAEVSRSASHHYGWTEVPTVVHVENRARETHIAWDWPQPVPLGRVLVETAEGRRFWRRIELRKADNAVVAHGSIWRVNAGTTSTTNTELLVPEEKTSKRFTLVIDNGDDAPLPISKVHAAYHERRLYFDPQGLSSLRLYFGDNELEPPSYDFSKLSTVFGAGTRANVGPVQSNPIYVARPDTRPWTERHPAVLWIALGGALVTLGGLALRGLKTA